MPEVPQILAEVIAVGRERVAQQLEQAVPGGLELTARLLADDAPVPVERAAAQHLDAEIRARIDADGADGFAQLRMRDDAGAAAGELGIGPLKDVDMPAAPAQQERREQAAHRAADDDGTPRFVSCHRLLPDVRAGPA